MIKIFPNPANGNLNIEYALMATKETKTLIIYDIHGVLVKTIPVAEPIGLFAN